MVDVQTARQMVQDPHSSTEEWDALFTDTDLLKSAAFTLPDSTVLGVPPVLRIRRDSTQIVCCRCSLFDVSISRLNSAQIVALSVFDGQRDLRQASERLAELGRCSYTAAEMKLRRFLAWANYPEKQELVRAVSAPGREDTLQIDPADYILPTNEYRTRLDKPVSLMLMPTDRCVTDCIYCYACRRAVDPAKLLTVERIDQLMDEARSLGVRMVNLDGGDLFARREHVEIIDAITGRGMEVGISTKGHISKEKARQIYDSGIRWIQVGLDAPTNEMSAYLVNRHEYFDHAVDTIRNLAEAGIRTRTNSIIVRETLHLLPDLVDLLMTLPLINVKIAPAFRPIYRGGESMLLTREQKLWFREQMKRMEEKYAHRKDDINWECREDTLDVSRDVRGARFSDRPLCSSGRTQIIITPDGKVTTCEQSPQTGEFICGDCSVQSIEEVWNSREIEAWYNPPREKFQGTACYECPDFLGCVPVRGQCWLHAYRAYGTPYAPDPDCPRAPLPSERWE